MRVQTTYVAGAIVPSMPRLEVLTRISAMWVMAATWCLMLGGCGDGVIPSSADQLQDFERAGPTGPAVDLDGLTKARLVTGPYRVKPEEVLDLTMPAIVRLVTAEEPLWISQREEMTFLRVPGQPYGDDHSANRGGDPRSGQIDGGD